MNKDNNTTPETIYVVQASSGDWESYHEWVVGVFNNLRMANTLKNTLDAKAEKIKSECPFQYSDDLSEEDSSIYWDYYSLHETEMEWCGVRIEECDLNIPIEY
jgi:hypothetical protein